jgi:hypothetical protein
MFELVHFRGADKIIKEKKMANGVRQLMEYIHDCLFGTRYKSELLRQALTEMDWKNGDLNILDGRRYFYKGFKNRIALDGSFSSNIYKMLCSNYRSALTRKRSIWVLSWSRRREAKRANWEAPKNWSPRK